MEHICTLCNHYSRTDEQSERHEKTDAHRIAALEAEKAKLVEALEQMLNIFDREGTRGTGETIGKITCDEARAVLAEVIGHAK